MGINLQDYIGHHSLAWSTQTRETKLHLFRKSYAHGSLQVSYWSPPRKQNWKLHPCLFPLTSPIEEFKNLKITFSYKILVLKLIIVIHWSPNFPKIFWSKVLSKYLSSSQTHPLLESFSFKEFRVNHGTGLPRKTYSAKDFSDPDEQSLNCFETSSAPWGKTLGGIK